MNNKDSLTPSWRRFFFMSGTKKKNFIPSCLRLKTKKKGEKKEEEEFANWPKNLFLAFRHRLKNAEKAAKALWKIHPSIIVHPHPLKLSFLRVLHFKITHKIMINNKSSEDGNYCDYAWLGLVMIQRRCLSFVQMDLSADVEKKGLNEVKRLGQRIPCWEM